MFCRKLKSKVELLDGQIFELKKEIFRLKNPLPPIGSTVWVNERKAVLVDSKVVESDYRWLRGYLEYDLTLLIGSEKHNAHGVNLVLFNPKIHKIKKK